MKWNDTHKNPPKDGQKIYYFGPNIGLWVGTYNYKINGITTSKGEYIELCPHLFSPSNSFGVCDGCDAPYWLEYDEEKENKGWRPIVPENYTKDLYD